ncbi:MAG TPA: DUF1003 domain-containing protein [Candidatus Acidoferrum sp.]|nr:DUF1003 domain-containing protein [Candidatus Acidoferrum sp.]
MATVAPLGGVQNVDDVYRETLKPLDRVAIKVAAVVGSWKFIIWQSVFFAVWIVLNLVGWSRSWDPYPFILMNLVLSLEAAYTAPLVMMAQNRDAERDRLMMLQDFETNRRAAEEVCKIVALLEQHGRILAVLGEERQRQRQSRL